MTNQSKISRHTFNPPGSDTEFKENPLHPTRRKSKAKQQISINQQTVNQHTSLHTTRLARNKRIIESTETTAKLGRLGKPQDLSFCTESVTSRYNGSSEHQTGFPIHLCNKQLGRSDSEVAIPSTRTNNHDNL
jgi:hypothetical protein